VDATSSVPEGNLQLTRQTKRERQDMAIPIFSSVPFFQHRHFKLRPVNPKQNEEKKQQLKN